MAFGMEEQQKTKSFWERPEGTTGMITLAAAGVGLYFAAPALLAFIGTLTAIVGSTIMLVLGGVVLFILLNIVFNKKVQTLVRYGFKSLMRKITGAFVEIDPIGIMKSYVEDLVEKREVMAESRDKLRGQITVLEKQIQQNTSEYESSMARAKLAQEKGNKAQVSVQARQAGRMDKLNKASLVPLLTQMQIHLRALNKYYEVTGVVIEDTRNEVKARSIEREMILASYSAMSAAKKILMGGTDDKELFDQAMEHVVEDLGMKMGEIDSFIENSRGFIEGLDMQNGVYEAAALEKLKEWENNAESVLLGTGKARLLENDLNNSVMATQIGVPAAQDSSDYASLLTRR